MIMRNTEDDINNVFVTIPKKILSLLCVSVDYSDYLEETLKHNSKIFDKIYIITSYNDQLTPVICKNYHNTVCLTTNTFYENGSVFNRGAALNYGLLNMEHSGWLTIGDADCIFPTVIRNDILNANTNCLYTYNRMLVRDASHLSNIFNQKELPINYHNKNARKVLGYCQIFNFSCKYFRKKSPFYPISSKNASKSDTGFSNSWPNHKKVLLKSGCVLHLGDPCKNWNGRKTPPWN